MPDTTPAGPLATELAATPERLALITRPNGHPYRARKITAHVLSDEHDFFSGVLVTGTHDQERALELARALVRRDLGPTYEPVWSGAGWWRDGMECGERRWVADDERGAAGVLFGKVEEVSFNG
jgi:hypothetical protein